MKTIVTLALLLMAILPAGAVKRIDANPINIAFILSQETDPDVIASTLFYYGYEPMEGRLPSRPAKAEATSTQSASAGLSSGETNSYTHPNGSMIRYTFKDATESQPYPQVEVKSNRGSKDIESTLESLDFKKKGSRYIRNTGQYAKTETHCTNESQSFLIFHRTKINRQE